MDSLQETGFDVRDYCSYLASSYFGGRNISRRSIRLVEIAFSRLGRKPGSPSRKLPSGWDQEQPRAYSANYGVIALDIDAGTYRLVTSTTKSGLSGHLSQHGDGNTPMTWQCIGYKITM